LGGVLDKATGQGRHFQGLFLAKTRNPIKLGIEDKLFLKTLDRRKRIAKVPQGFQKV